MAWVYLVAAAFFEIVWAIAMKQSAGFTHLRPTLVTIAGLLSSLGLLSVAMRSLPVGTAYALWTGIGAVGAFVAGVVLEHEPLTTLRAAAVLVILSGLVLLKLATPT